MEYLLIKDKGNGSALRARDLNAGLYDLTRPTPNPEDVTVGMLHEFVHPIDGTVCLGYDDGLQLPISKDMNALALKYIIADDATEAEKNALENYLQANKGKSILFRSIIPSGVQKRSQAWMEQNGWFVYEQNGL